MKENRVLISALALTVLAVPVVMIWGDTSIIAWAGAFKQGDSIVSSLYRTIGPVIAFLSLGGTIISIVLALYVIGRFISRRLHEVTRTLLIGFAVSGTGVQVLKHLIGRARPRVTNEILFIGPSLRGDYDSFPSGHTTVAFCLAYLLARACPRYGVAAYTVAAVFGFGRAIEVNHFASDILAGAVTGIAFGMTVRAFLKRRGQRRDHSGISMDR